MSLLKLILKSKQQSKNLILKPICTRIKELHKLDKSESWTTKCIGATFIKELFFDFNAVLFIRIFWIDQVIKEKRKIHHTRTILMK